MKHGRSNQLTQQVGEHLVTAELARRGLLSTPFSGNVPHIDLIAMLPSGDTKLIQVKAINVGSWQFDANKFVDIRFEGDVQIVGEVRTPPYDEMIYVFIVIGDYGQDVFHIISGKDLYQLLSSRYRDYLSARNGIRPRNPKSTHTALSPKELAEYVDNWEIITDEMVPNNGLELTHTQWSA